MDEYGNSFIKDSFFHQPLIPWLENNILNEIHSINGIEWPLVFITACYLVKHCRNLISFEDIGNAHIFLDYRVMKLAKDFKSNLASMVTTRKNIPTIVIKQVTWNLPP